MMLEKRRRSDPVHGMLDQPEDEEDPEEWGRRRDTSSGGLYEIFPIFLTYVHYVPNKLPQF